LRRGTYRGVCAVRQGSADAAEAPTLGCHCRA